MAVADLTNKACEKAGANPCKVIYLFGPVAFDYASITRKTFNDTVKAKYPNIKVVAQAAANFDPDTGGAAGAPAPAGPPGHQRHRQRLRPGARRDREGRRRPAQGQDHHRGRGRLKVGADAIKAGKQFGDTVILPATEAKAATLMAIKAARKQHVGDTTIDVTEDLSPVGTIVDASNVDKYKPEW